jgi:biopolymer transport protein ExbD
MQINLPTADASKPVDRPSQINVGVSATGQYMINRTAVAVTTPEALAAELRRAAGSNTDPVIIINADANSTHQSVINVMEAARVAGFSKITFTTQQQRR